MSFFAIPLVACLLVCSSIFSFIRRNQFNTLVEVDLESGKLVQLAYWWAVDQSHRSCHISVPIRSSAVIFLIGYAGLRDQYWQSVPYAIIAFTMGKMQRSTLSQPSTSKIWCTILGKMLAVPILFNDIPGIIVSEERFWVFPQQGA